MLLANGNFLLSKNTQNSSNTYNNIVVNLKKNKIYLDKEDDKRIASFAN